MPTSFMNKIFKNPNQTISKLNLAIYEEDNNIMAKLGFPRNSRMVSMRKLIYHIKINLRRKTI